MKCAGDELSLEASWLDDKLDGEPAADLLDSLLAPAHKPLPPITGYNGQLSINGIPIQHYAAIAQRLPEENNNYPTQSGYTTDHDVVSSSTCAVDTDLDDVKPFLHASDKSFLADTASGAPDSCSPPAKIFDEPSNYDISSIDDFAAMIGSALVDTTVPSHSEDADCTDSREGWMDIESWISGACNPHADKIVPQDLSEFLPNSPPPAPPAHHSSLDFSCKEYNKNAELLHKQTSSPLHTLLTQGYMPLLQTALQNGPSVKQEAPSSTSYGMDVISTSSPPGNAVSTTEGVGSLLGGRYSSHYGLSLKPDDRLLGYGHAHTTTSSKSKRSRAKAKQNAHHAALGFPNAADLSGLMGKEKTIHHCTICNRGFLNKSNIKVHLRTHTGEKPFRCDVCAKAFRQKAHLIKHQQIHKRIGRD